MRPQLPLRAAGTMLALGALSILATLAVHTAIARAASASGGTTAATTTVPKPTAPRFGPIARRLDVVGGHSVRASGSLRPARAGRVVLLQRRSGVRWITVDRDRTSATGRFALSYRPARRAIVRVRALGLDGRPGVRRVLGRVEVFRRAVASWYGPGLYGNKLGCGGRLTPGTLGVANKTLPCGARVTLRYRGRRVRVAVVDRGPYVAGRDFDLTAATKRRLGFGSTGVVLASR